MRYIRPEVIISARLGSRERPTYSKAALVFHSENRSRFSIRRFGGTPIGYKLLGGVGPNDVFATPDNRTVIVSSIGSHGAGGPLTSCLIEELTCYGVRAVVGIGCAGSLNQKLRRGEQFYAVRALCTDGASRIYRQDDPGSISIPTAEAACVDNATSELGIEVHGTTGATVDVLYRETPELLQKWREKGAEWINMEVTPFYASAQACGMRAVYIGHISDELFGAEWNGWFGSERDEMARLSAEVAARVLESL